MWLWLVRAFSGWAYLLTPLTDCAYLGYTDNIMLNRLYFFRVFVWTEYKNAHVLLLMVAKH
jgi:hypothetical protein